MKEVDTKNNISCHRYFPSNNIALEMRLRWILSSTLIVTVILIGTSFRNSFHYTEQKNLVSLS